jgi:hypothetical protein
MEKKYNLTKTFENAETRKLKAILNVQEIRSGRLPIDVSVGSISDFKTGKRTVINKEFFLELKIILNNFSVLLSDFSKKEVTESEEYLLELMEIIQIPFLNWVEFYKKIDAIEKPNYQYLLYSYFQDRKPSEKIIGKFPHFFEQMRFEFKLLSSKIKL